MKRSNLILALAIFLCALGCNDENSLLNPGPVIELNNIEKTPQFVSCSKVLQTVRIDQFNRPEGLWMRDIHFPTRDIGYGVNTGVIIKTYDGGAHWEIQDWKHIHGVSNPSSLTSALLYAVYFVNPQVGFAGGDDEEFGTGEFPAVFLSTTDGGQTWKKSLLQGIEIVRDLYFFDENNGLALLDIRTPGDYLYNVPHYTKNGGKSWTKADLPFTSFKGPMMITPNAIRLVGNTYDASFLITITNKGEDWRLDPMPVYPANKIYFIDDQIGFVAGGLLFYPENQGKTTDGGLTWSPTNLPITNSSVIHFFNSQHGFVINEVIEYEEGGGEWNPILKAYEISETYNGGKDCFTYKVAIDCNLTGTSYSPSRDLFYSYGEYVNRFELK